MTGFVGASLQVTLDKLASPELLNFARHWVVDADLNRMKKVVTELLAVISDAEEKQFKNQEVRMWLDELKDVVYDAEDVLDLFETETLRFKLEELGSPSHTDYTSPLQAWDRFTSYFTSITHWFSLNIEIKHKIKEITERLEDIAKEKNDLGLEGTRGSLVGGSSVGTIEPRLPTSSLVYEPHAYLPTSSLVYEPHAYGREKDVENMIQLLLPKEPCDDNVGVIPVVGPGGIGKTTFAQQLYNHIEVEKHFDLRGWVCLSGVFDVIQITKVIIESMNGNSCGLQELSLVHDKLEKTMEGRKFLLILDDVWIEKYEDWVALSTPFKAGAKGSKIIITTRSEKVSSITGTVAPHRLELLSEEDSFKLLKLHAFQNQNLEAQPSLETIGKEIARKCEGLPLAAKALGGVLHSKRGEDDWQGILNSEMWDLETEVGPALWLSYFHLPEHLKRCFVYCGIFPKNYEFDKEELIRLWMAEGFVGQKQNLTMDDIGEGYFYGLVSRSFFQQSIQDASKFVMHDLINDLARAALGEMCFTMYDEEQREKQIYKKTRHLSYWNHQYEDWTRFEAFYGANKLRTFLSPQKCEWQHNFLPFQVPYDLLSRLVCLRVLSLRTYKNIIELPESIGDLVHLRYLDLSYTSIRRLPESINALYNLQTLLLQCCKRLKELPSNLGNLTNLRFLDINGCDGLQQMARGIGRLKELQILPRFIVDENNGAGIEELTDLQHLRGTLQISRLENIKDPIHKKIDLRNKQHLQTLDFKWDGCHLKVNDSQVKSVAKHVLDRLEPHSNLKGLTVEGYHGTSFSIWLENPLCCSNLLKLNLHNCKNCESLPSLGQLPLLEELSISGVPELKEWIGVGRQGGEAFPRLQNLKMQCCPKLKKVSHCFPALVKLEIESCRELIAFSRPPSVVQFDATSFPRILPSLNQLSLGDCSYELLQNVASFTPLISLSIGGISRLACLPHEEAFLQCLTALQRLEICDCHDMTLLWSCNEVVGEGLQQYHLTSLQELVISSCHKLERLFDGLQHLTSLKVLMVDDCPAIGSFLEEIELPTMLNRISITNCKNLKSLPEDFFMHTSLEELEIQGCSSLKSFSRRDAGHSSSTGTNISNLKRITIGYCENLESLPKGLHNLASLEKLYVCGCPSLTSFPDRIYSLSCLEMLVIRMCPRLLSFPEGGLPSTKLKYLEIMGCEDLKSLPNQMILLTSLESLKLGDCPNLLSIPEWSLCSSNLRHLGITSSKGQPHSLTSLRNLCIANCPGLISFPEGIFPSNLQSLVISIGDNTLLPSLAWEFHFCRFTSLRRLTIFGCKGTGSFPDWLLPITLTSLDIWKFPDLKALPEGLQNLTSLEFLSIHNCPKLASLPEKGLPTTLCKLSINHCPMLKQWYEKKKGKYWPIFAKIACVEIDSKVVFDSFASQELPNFTLQWGVDADLERMKKVVSKLLATIGDVEAKQFKNVLAKKWLEDLKDVVYDAKDVLDLFEMERLHCKLNQSNSLSHIDYISSTQVWDHITDSFSLSNDIQSKIKEITKRLEDIAKEKNDIELIEGTRATSSGGRSIVTMQPRLITTSIVNELNVYGRENDLATVDASSLACEEVVLTVGYSAKREGNIPVCEGVVGASLQVLFDSLDSPELVNFAHQCGVEADLIQGMEDKVLEILPVISDVEAKQFKSKQVETWLVELKDVVYDAEDVMDLIQTGSLRCKLKQSDSPSHTDYNSPHQVLLDPSTSSLSSTEHFFQLNDKIKEITKRLEGIARCKEGLGLTKRTPGNWARESSIVSIETRLPTSSLKQEPHIYGRERDVDEMIKLLLSAEPCNGNVGVLPIVGQGGIGKTTFAQRLYNHKAVKKHFKVRAWVCVSDVFDLIRVTKGIIESASGESCDLTQLPAIHEALKKMLAGRKFLIVLDDVWTEEYKDWIALSTQFEVGAKGSKVIITTRSEKVCLITGTVPSHHLKLLSEEDSFELLKRYASIQNLDAQPALERIGKEIARKCKGLPLAAKALGGVLRSKQGEIEWKEILDSDIWALKIELNPALWLSYRYLPAYLKRCFVYSGIIPKDCEFSKEKLIRLWMAQGFLEQKAENHKKRMEDIGEGYFCELVSRSFFQQSCDDKFVMHDLVNDLARAASGETCLTMDEEKQWEKLISEKTRHVSYSEHHYRETEIPSSEGFYRANKLRTFAYFGDWYWRMGSRIRIKAPELLSRLVCLRALCLNSDFIDELPESVGNLVHLRYLDLSGTSIRRLPESINALCNLQTLLLRDCPELEEWPINMGNLINLRCFDFSESLGLEKMPRGIGRLKELQMLPYFIVDENNDIGIEELTNLEHLRGTLEILGLQAIRNPIHAFKINLRNQQHLHTLKLVWYDSDQEIDSESKSVAELVLGRLQPHTNLERLIVSGYYGTCSPSWLVDPSCYLNLAEREEQTSLSIYNKVVEGGLQYHHHLTHLQVFPMLKHILIRFCKNLECLPEELFLLPSLEHLEIERCYSLNSFSRRDSRCSSSTTTIKITKLKRIVIRKCENLESLPESLHKLTSLESLCIHECSSLMSLPHGMHHLCCLQELRIYKCPHLLSFPEGGLPSTKLKCLTIEGCEDLQSLPNQMILLTSLEKLRIAGCPNLLSIPKGGLPSINLRDLQIYDCKGLKSLGNQQHSLTSLCSLSIRECNALTSFPESLFPRHLESLTISITPNTYRPLSKWKFHFHIFTSLRELDISGCEGIVSLSDLLLPKTLPNLEIRKCPHLKALPGPATPHLP